MCLIAWNWQPDSETPLVLIGNRDEYYARPAQPMHWWENKPILAGKDLQAGGTWLGLSRNGRLAALTNFRQGNEHRTDAPSRGQLVTDFLEGSLGADAYLAALASNEYRYNPFNLLLWDGRTLTGFESRHARVHHMAPGIGGVSNADFDTPWPKLVFLKSALQALLQRPAQPPAEPALLLLLQNRQQAQDANLPSTGIAMERERVLSAPFIAAADYGTRACSIVRLGQHRAHVDEYSFNASGPGGHVRFDFRFDRTGGNAR